MVGRQKKFNFFLCVFGWKDRNFFFLVEIKNERMKNEISINLKLYPH